MSDTPKRIEPDAVYPCCKCYDEYSWSKEDLRWYKNELWCANCFDQLNEDGERMSWRDLEVFVPKLENELAKVSADFALMKDVLTAFREVLTGRNQLIEQMQKALKAVIRVADRATEEFDLARAALAAAEKKEKGE